MFAIYVHAMVSNEYRCNEGVSKMGTYTKWKITKCDGINFIVINIFGEKCDNSTESRVRMEVHFSNYSSYILCTLPLVVVDLGGCFTTLSNLFAIPKRLGSFNMCWSRTDPQNMRKYPRQGEKLSRRNEHARL